MVIIRTSTTSRNMFLGVERLQHDSVWLELRVGLSHRLKTFAGKGEGVERVPAVARLLIIP